MTWDRLAEVGRAEVCCLSVSDRISKAAWTKLGVVRTASSTPVGGDCVLVGSSRTCPSGAGEVGAAELFGSTISTSVSGVVSMTSSSTAATSTATELVRVASGLLCESAGSSFGTPSPSCMSASSRSCLWPTGGNVVVEVLMSTSAGGAGGGGSREGAA